MNALPISQPFDKTNDRGSVRSTGSRLRGFTVIELLVVITVIALLAAILVPVVGSAFRRANEFAIQTEMSQLDQAIEQFKNKYGFYPPNIDPNDVLPGGIGSAAEMLPYLNRISPNHNEGNGTAGTQLEQWWNTVGVNIDPTKGEDLVFWLTGLAKNKQFPLTAGEPAANWLAYDGNNIERDSFIDLETDRLLIDADNRTAGYAQARGPDVPYLYVQANSYGTIAAPIAYHDGTNFFNPDSFQLVAWGLDGQPGNPGPVANVGSAGLDNIVNFIGDGSGRLESKVLGTD